MHSPSSTLNRTEPRRITNGTLVAASRTTGPHGGRFIHPSDKSRRTKARCYEPSIDLLPSTVTDEVSDIQQGNVMTFLSDLIRSRKLSQSFYVMNMTTVEELYVVWKKMLPRVRPYYAVKCNPDAMLIRWLHGLGAGFDCASEKEIRSVMHEGVPSNDIIFANPCKAPSELLTSGLLGIDLTTFDTIYELKKIQQWIPDVRVLLRIRADDPTARFLLGSKYGAEMNEVPALYEEAKKSGIKVVGIAFHVGSRATDPEAFSRAIAAARQAFDLGLEYEFEMSILDIGGGFHSADVNGDMSVFKAMTEVINRSLDVHFPIGSGIKIMAEPGTFFAERCTTLVSNVIGVRERSRNGTRHRDYWIADGVFGSFHPITLNVLDLNPIPLRQSHRSDDPSISSTIFGPTCDSTDVVMKETMLPEIFPGDWIVFPNMGAYTSGLVTKYNGMHGDMETFHVQSDTSGFILSLV